MFFDKYQPERGSETRGGPTTDDAVRRGGLSPRAALWLALSLDSFWLAASDDKSPQLFFTFIKTLATRVTMIGPRAEMTKAQIGLDFFRLTKQARRRARPKPTKHVRISNTSFYWMNTVELFYFELN